MVYPSVSLYAVMLAAAGIPMYIHLPRFVSVNLRIGLGELCAILLLIRLVDSVQDPAIGCAMFPQKSADANYSLSHFRLSNRSLRKLRTVFLSNRVLHLKLVAARIFGEII